MSTTLAPAPPSTDVTDPRLRKRSGSARRRYRRDRDLAGVQPRRELPAEYRRPLVARLDELLADPRAQRCAPECVSCAKVPEEIAGMVLALWDEQARSGAWPIDTRRIHDVLSERGIAIDHQPIRRVVKHRRLFVLNAHVRRDLDAAERERETAVSA